MNGYDYTAMAVALMKPSSSPCGEFMVQLDGFAIAELDGEDHFALKVNWNSETETRSHRMERTKQRAPIVEGAATALAALLFSHLVQDSEWDVTLRGEGPDFWLPRLNQGLEISGTERTAELGSRRREKERQLLGNSFGWDGFVVLCCFAESRRLIQWIYCSHEG